MTVKPIRWFEVASAVAPAFHNSSQSTAVVCLNYKDHDDPAAGLEPWWLLGRIALVVLVSENDWGPNGHWGCLEVGAQQMLDYAEADADVGFQNGDFYGIFWIQQEVAQRAVVHLGLAYASSASPLRPVTGMVERTFIDEHHTWVTPQCALPLQVEVQIMGEAPKVEVVHRVSRYKRTPVI